MIRTGDVIYNSITGESIRFVETAADSDGERVVIDVLVEPSGFVASAHQHPYQTEVFEVVEGELMFKVGGETITATAGTSVTVEPGTAHRFWNASESAVRFRCEVTPALQFEKLLETMFGLANDGKTNKKGLPNPVPARRDREPPLRRRAAAVPAGVAAEARPRGRRSRRPPARLSPGLRAGRGRADVSLAI